MKDGTPSSYRNIRGVLHDLGIERMESLTGLHGIRLEYSTNCSRIIWDSLRSSSSIPLQRKRMPGRFDAHGYMDNGDEVFIDFQNKTAFHDTELSAEHDRLHQEFVYEYNKINNAWYIIIAIESDMNGRNAKMKQELSRRLLGIRYGVKRNVLVRPYRRKTGTKAVMYERKQANIGFGEKPAISHSYVKASNNAFYYDDDSYIVYHGKVVKSSFITLEERQNVIREKIYYDISVERNIPLDKLKEINPAA